MHKDYYSARQCWSIVPATANMHPIVGFYLVRYLVIYPKRLTNKDNRSNQNQQKSNNF